MMTCATLFSVVFICTISHQSFVLHRFEWSVGYNKLSYPSGIYNSAEEKVWQDSGRLMDCIFAAKPG